ncbi:MAG: redoxin domain-containing protein, partial [Planctomycetaceae bacterium]|nr:redoxin domain-containing protein [Planctomycetaceae bacterium]
AQEKRAGLQQRLDAEKTSQSEAGDKAEAKAREEKKDDKAVAAARKSAQDGFRAQIRELEQAIQEIDGRLAYAAGDFTNAIDLLKKSGGVRVEQLVEAMLKAGQNEDAQKRINDYVRTHQGETLPLACQVETYWKLDQREEARKALENLQRISSDIDLDIPAFARIAPIAAALGIEGDWRQPHVAAADIGARPELDSLGPFRWQPVTAPPWNLADQTGQRFELSAYRGRSVVVIFYLGYGCLHCAEQLQKFAPEVKRFREAGLEVVAISTDKQEDLALAHKNYEGDFPITLLADAELNVFRQYRCYDDFENQSLHGTFVIDGEGRIRWQDISYEPFMDVDFVLKEGTRLLAIDPTGRQVTSESSAVTAAE